MKFLKILGSTLFFMVMAGFLGLLWALAFAGFGTGHPILALVFILTSSVPVAALFWWIE